MIQVKVSSKRALAAMTSLRTGLTPEAVDEVINRAAWKVFADVVRATPKKWFGALRRAWVVIKTAPGVRLLRNDSPVMRHIEFGTANAGTGYIYPTKAKALFIPLTREAAMANRSVFTKVRQSVSAGFGHGGGIAKTEKGISVPKGKSTFRTLIYGVDYILRRRVRGIKPRGIVAKEAVKASETIKAEMVAYIRRLVKVA